MRAGDRTPDRQRFPVSMCTDFPIDPDRQARLIYVGQDRAGHWLVQDSAGQLEGRFISRGDANKMPRPARGLATDRGERPLEGTLGRGV